MGNGMQNLVADPETFLQLSTEQRVRTVLLVSRRTPEQIEAMMVRHAPISVLVNNISTCHSSADQICACMPDKIEHELAKYPPKNRLWTHFEEREILMAVVKLCNTIPAKLRAEFCSITSRRDMSMDHFTLPLEPEAA